MRWWSRRSLLVHVLLVAFVGACAALADWQVHRALSGNELSWAYVFEWPFFAAYACYVWWRVVHETPLWRPRTDKPVSTNGHGPPPPSDEDRREDAELAAYNRYLAELAAYDERHDEPARGTQRAEQEAPDPD